MARERGEGRQDGLEDRVVKIRRCAAVVKGGGRFSFTLEVVHPWFGETVRQVAFFRDTRT